MTTLRQSLMARFYDRAMAALEDRCLGQWRRELLADLQGEVLELGSGTGVNLPRYPAGLRRLVLTEPDAAMRRRLRGRCPSVPVAGCSAEALPFADASFDVVVATLVFCSVQDPAGSLSEVRRVLRPQGELRLIEHVASKDSGLLRWQKRIEPGWKWLCGNCHLSRPTEALLREAGFDVKGLRRDAFVKVPKIVSPVLRGRALKRP